MATKQNNVTPFRRSRDRKIIAAVDLGVSKVACFIAELTGDEDRHFSADIIGVGFHGMPQRPGAAIAPDDWETGLRRALDAAERMAGARVHKVYVAAPGRAVRARRIGVDLEIADGVITEEDVEDCLREGAMLCAAPGCDSLMTAPIAYRLDNEFEYDDPVGQAGSILSTEIIGLSMRDSLFENISAIIERSGLKAADFVAAPLAAAESCVDEDEKDLGVLLVDIGAGSTGYAVYDSGALVDCGGIGLGAGNITKDIAQIFGAPLAEAERIKILHGAALIGPGDEHRFIDFPQLGAGAETLRASRADLCEVVIARMEEIFEKVAERLPDDARRRASLRRAVITGGGSLLPGAREIAEKSLSMSTRIGRPLSAFGAPEAGRGPGFTVCAGLIQHAASGAELNKFSLGVPGQSLHSLTRPALLGGVEAWFRAKF